MPSESAAPEPGSLLGYAPEVDQRLNDLLRDIGRHIDRLYRGENIGSPEAIPLLSRCFKLAEAACGISSHSSVQDVLDEIDEAI